MCTVFLIEYDMKAKKTLWAACIAAVLLLCSCSRGQKTGVIRVRVLDGYTDLPIAGACVTVPETEERFITNSDGMTEAMRLPVMPDPQYDSLAPSASGRITLLVRAEGRTPYLLLYARVTPDSERRIDVLLFPDDGSIPVFTVIEAPDGEWCERLVQRYGK